MTTTIHSVSDVPVPPPPTSHQTRIGTSISTVTSPKRLARIAGVLYLLVGITGGFAEGFVEPKVYVAGDAAATAAAVVANAGLVRLGVVSDLLDQTFFVFLALSLYVLLQHVQSTEGVTTLLITHSIIEAIFCADRVLVMSGRPGAIIDDIRIPFERPRRLALRETAEFTTIGRRIREHFEKAGVLVG